MTYECLDTRDQCNVVKHIIFDTPRYSLQIVSRLYLTYGIKITYFNLEYARLLIRCQVTYNSDIRTRGEKQGINNEKPIPWCIASDPYFRVA